MEGISIKVRKTDGEENTYSIRPRAIVEWEQKFNKGLAKMLGEELRFEQLYYLAWVVMRNSGVSPKPFGNDFLDTLAHVELVSDEDFVSTEIA